MTTTAEQIADLISGYTDLKSYFENSRNDIENRVRQKEQQVDQFLQDALPETRYVQDIKIEGSTDFYYPVWWRFPNSFSGTSSITICRHYSQNGSEGDRPLDPSRPHQAALLLELEGNAVGWDGDANFMQIKRFHERYNNTASHAQFRMYCHAETFDNLPIHSGFTPEFRAQHPRFSGVFLRGGGLNYRIIKNWKGDVEFHDGSNMDRAELGQWSNGENAVRWFTMPQPISDRIRPEGTINAYQPPAE